VLRIHYPLCQEVRSRSQPLDNPTFNRVSKRYAALKSGIPQQELRFPILRNQHHIYVWTFSENLLVLQSAVPDIHRVFLNLIYLDPRSDSRKIRNGRVELQDVGRWDFGGKHLVTKVMVCPTFLTFSMSR
jgi:hypothetical protein